MKRLSHVFLYRRRTEFKSAGTTGNSSPSGKKQFWAETIQPEDGYDWLRQIKEHSAHGARSI